MSQLTEEQQKQIEDGFVKKVHEILSQKKALEFSVEAYIFKKK
jgi:hypothetical protein